MQCTPCWPAAYYCLLLLLRQVTEGKVATPAGLGWAGLGWAGLGMFTNGAAARAVEDNADWDGDGECCGDSEEVD